jgi:hypothetical protein
MVPTLCHLCQEEIPFTRKQNSKFCSYECYYENKKSDAAIANRKNTEQRILLFNDEIIHELFLNYKSDYYISTEYLIKRNFKWNISSGELDIYGLKAKKLIRYAYTLFQNQTVQLWKL